MSKINWKQYVKKGVKVLSEAADVAVHLKANPGPLGMVAVGARVVNAINEVASSDKSDFFKGWKALGGVYPLSDFLFLLCKRARLLVDENKKGSNSLVPKEESKVVTAVIHGYKVGWTEHQTWKDGPYCAPGQDPAKAEEVLRVLIWEMMGKSLKYYDPPLGSPILIDDSIDEILPSKTAQDMWNKQRKFIKAGHRRSVLLYGEPGVGKSNIVRHVAGLAGGYHIRIRARDLESLRSLGHLVSFLQPSAVIIDDLDRAKNADGILEEFDEIKAEAKLFMVTANRIDRLDPATIRRFDDTFHVQKLDEDVLTRLLTGISTDIATRLRELPITYIDQYRKMHDVLGPEEASKELDGLVERRELVLKMVSEDKDKKTGKKAEEVPCVP